jgi:hypothetical protein
MSITPEELLQRYADSRRKDPKAAIRMVMWLMIYDGEPASWARDFLEDASFLTKPEDARARNSQIQKVRRWRTAAEESVGLPPRGKRGTTSDYKQALRAWKRINPRPTDEELLAGWTPKPLPASEIPSEIKSGLQHMPENPVQPEPSGAETRDTFDEEDLDSPKPRKRASVAPPPSYKPEDYLPKPQPPMKIPICGLPDTGAD